MANFKQLIQYSLISTVLLKLGSFVLTQSLLNYITPENLVFNNYLDWLINLIVFFSNEAIKISIQRYVKLGKDGKNIQSLINYSFLSVLLGCFITLVMFYLEINNIKRHLVEEIPILEFNNHQQLYIILVGIYITVITGLINEFYYNLNNYYGNFTKNLKNESIGLLINGIWNFSIIKVLSSYYNGKTFERLLLFVFLLGKFWNFSYIFIKNYNFKFYKIDKLNNYYFDPIILKYFESIYLQLIFKYLLNQGDVFLINKKISLKNQGEFLILNNYGNLITRLLFNPIEENLKLYYTKHKDVTVFQNILKIYIYLTLIILLFGKNNLHFLINFIFSILKIQWQLNYNLVNIYLIYLPILAINGVFESYFQSINNLKSLNFYSGFLILNSVFYFVNCYYLMNQYQLIGLIVANILNFSLRILVCGSLIYKNDQFIFDKLKFSKFIIGISVLIGVLQYYLKETSNWILLGVNGGVGLIYLIFIGFNEKKLLNDLLNFKSDKSDQNDHENINKNGISKNENDGNINKGKQE